MERATTVPVATREALSVAGRVLAAARRHSDVARPCDACGKDFFPFKRTHRFCHPRCKRFFHNGLRHPAVGQLHTDYSPYFSHEAIARFIQEAATLYGESHLDPTLAARDYLNQKLAEHRATEARYPAQSRAKATLLDAVGLGPAGRPVKRKHKRRKRVT